MAKMDGKFTSKPAKLYGEGALNNGEAIELHGMVHNLRDMGKFSFLDLRTADCIIQCVISHDVLGELKLKNESAVSLEGRAVEDERSKLGYEIQVSAINSLSTPKEDVPVNINKSKSSYNIETDLTYRAVTLRSSRKRAIFRLQAGLAAGFRDFFNKNSFTEIFSPKIVASGAEGGANIFKLEYFGQKAYLAQSPQFYKQMMIPVFERVYEIAPVFRAEKHNTVRHLNEYISIDAEIGFIDSFYDIMNLETAMLQHAFAYLNEYYGDVLTELTLTLPDASAIPTIGFTEAKEKVAAKYDRRIRDPYDLEPEEERLISELFKEEENSEFVFVTHYPSKKRPFYAMDDPQNPKFTLSFDLLYRGMEVTTGGQRIHDYDMQVEKMQAKGLDPADFESYLMLHKYGCPPHGGMGLGLERLCMKLLDEPNIRAASLFPRDTLRLLP